MKNLIITILFIIIVTYCNGQNNFEPFLSIETSINTNINKLFNWEFNAIGNISKKTSILISHEHYRDWDNVLFGIEYAPINGYNNSNNILFKLGGKAGIDSKDVPINEFVDVKFASLFYVKEQLNIKPWIGLALQQRMCFNRKKYFENRISLILNIK